MLRAIVFQNMKKLFGFFTRPTALFFSLIIFSFAVFVSADDAFSGKNIFEDSDSDGLSNEEERLYGTDPLVKDTDGDGYSDGAEVRGGYDPLVKAPGDRIIQKTSVSESSVSSDASKENLTKKVSESVAGLVTESGQGEISLDQVDTVVAEAIDGTGGGEVVLPEVNVDEIKIRKLSKKEKKLDKEERTKKEREHIVEYLTSMAYVFANNSPIAITKESDFELLSMNLANESMNALARGDSSIVENLSNSGENMLEQIYDIEVPEAMVEMHMKAIRMAKYAVKLKEDIVLLEKKADDPLKSIAMYSRLQALLSITISLIGEFQSKLGEYGVKVVPIDF